MYFSIYYINGQVNYKIKYLMKNYIYYNINTIKKLNILLKFYI